MKESITFKDITDKCVKVYEVKNADYGNSTTKTYELFGDVSYATRLNDKINRVNNLLKNGNQAVNDESIDDTILDIANYCILWLVDRINNN